MNGGADGSTVWMGSAFNGCDINEITLLHNRFQLQGVTTAQCNSGQISLITGRSMNIVENSSYISTLEVLVNPGHDDMPVKTIQCAHDNGIKVIIDINSTIIIDISVVCMPSKILNDSATDNTTSLKGIMHA